MKKYFFTVLLTLLTGFLFSQIAWAANKTRVYNVRTGIHAGFTRLVLDCEGAHPLKIGPATSKGITIRYKALDLLVDDKHLSRNAEGGIAKIIDHKEQTPPAITVIFRDPNLRVKSYFLSEEPSKKGFYKLVLDLYPSANPKPEKAQMVKASRSARPTRTRVYNIRTGIHAGFTRLVLHSEGAYPLQIASASSKEIAIQYEALDLLVEPKKLSRSIDGDIAKIIYDKEKSPPAVTITFRHPSPRVKSYFLPEEPPKKGFYKLVLDLHPAAKSGPERGRASSWKVASIEEPEEQITTAVQKTSDSGNREAMKPSRAAEPGPQESADLTVAAKADDDTVPPPSSDESEEEASNGESRFSGHAGLFLRALRGEDESSKFMEYSDIEPISGELTLKYEKEDRYFSELIATDIGEDDRYLNLAGGVYGKFGIDFSYDKIPHRFAYGAKTLYSGVGTDVLTLDPALQARLQSGTTTIEEAFTNAVSGDPALFIDKGKMSMDLVALDPFSIRVEVGRTSRSGTKPFFGSFGLDNTEEIPQPIDDETRELRFITEYAKMPLNLNATYYFSQFKNDFETLVWDNPFRVTDALFGPSKGRLVLPPDNQYHNISVSGAYMDLPLRSQFSATAAWGWMMQDEDLVPYTINTAVPTPGLPTGNVDAEVRTALYHALFNSRPASFMRVKAEFRRFEYNNNTSQIDFPGYVNADDFFVPTPIVNLPTSYDKTEAGLNLGFDLPKKTGLNFGYAFERTNRTNREVDQQEDRILSGSLDTKPFSWLDLGISYERTDREIGDYDFDVYLASGVDLRQLPGLRKYTEADVVRDRGKFFATVYPANPLAFTGSFIYGQDDFEDSPYGLLEDKHYIFTIDAAYTPSDRLNLHAFYSYEKYESQQKSFGEVPTEPFPTDSDWFSNSEEVVNTIGGEVNIGLIPRRLNFNLSYSWTEVDGTIDFFTPAVATADFPIVDDTKLQILNAELKYLVGHGISVSLGYLWEKFDYDDFDTEGFTYTPTGAVLMGTLPQDYDAMVLYLKFSYRF